MPNKNRTRLKIITPNGIFYDQDVSIVTVKTTEGYIGIQSGRIPIVASIEISPLVIGTKGASNYKDCAIAGGLLYADQNSVTIIIDAVKRNLKLILKVLKVKKQKLNKLLKHKKTLHTIIWKF